MVLISVFLGMYYNVVLAYTVNYFMKSFISPLPWTTCNHTFSVPDCSEVRNTSKYRNSITFVKMVKNTHRDKTLIYSFVFNYEYINVGCQNKICDKTAIGFLNW